MGKQAHLSREEHTRRTEIEIEQIRATVRARIDARRQAAGPSSKQHSRPAGSLQAHGSKSPRNFPNSGEPIPRLLHTFDTVTGELEEELERVDQQIEDADPEFQKEFAKEMTKYGLKRLGRSLIPWKKEYQYKDEGTDGGEKS